MRAGMVYLVGAGPGDPGLITQKGLACIRRADVVVYDRLVSPALVAQSRPDAEKIYVGKKRGLHALDQAAINGLLAERAGEGKVVCRLKGGDPFLFGRGGEEAGLLVDLSIPFEVIPGVTSGISVPAYAGIPVTHRGISGSVTLVTGHEAACKGADAAVDWSRVANAAETLLIYMGVVALPEIAERLTAHGRRPETPVAVIRWGTRSEQVTVMGTLATIAEAVKQAGVRPPAIIVVGDVVGLRERLRWAEMKPLFGRRFLLPTLGEAEQPMADELRDLGAEVWEWPVAYVTDPVDWVASPLRVAVCRAEPRLDTADLLRDVLRDGMVQQILLTSPAVLAPLLETAGGLDGVGILCTTERAAEAVREAGMPAPPVAHSGARVLELLTSKGR